MSDDKLNHSHGVSNETLIEQAVNSVLNTGTQNTNYHSHDVSDSSGNTGHGTGHSASEAESNAVSDYHDNK